MGKIIYNHRKRNICEEAPYEEMSQSIPAHPIYQNMSREDQKILKAYIRIQNKMPSGEKYMREMSPNIGN